MQNEKATLTPTTIIQNLVAFDHPKGYKHTLNLFFFEWIATTERREVIEHYKLLKQFFNQLEQSPQIKKPLY